MTDKLDHLVDIGDGDGETDQHMRTVARLAQEIFRAPADDFLAEVDKGLQEIEQVHLLRLAAVERNHVCAKGRLQRREAIKLVQHDIGDGVALQFDHDAFFFFFFFVADVGDALDALVAHQFGHLFDHRGLVDLIGDLRDDDGFAVVAGGFDGHPAAHHDGATTCLVGAADAGPPEDETAGREIGPRDQFLQLGQADRRIVDHGHTAIDDFRQIMRRNIGRHADRDTAGTIDQEVRIACGKHLGLAGGAVIRVLKIDRFLVDVFQKLVSAFGEPRLGIAHGRRRIAVDGAEIALTVDKRQAHGPVLRHAHQRVIDRRVAMGVVFTHHVGDRARRFHIFAVPVIAALVRGVENAPVHRLQPVARIRKSAAHDHAHRVVEIGALHLLDNGNRLDVVGLARSGRRRLVSQIVSHTK